MKSIWKEIETAPNAVPALIWQRRLGPLFKAVKDICLRDTQRTAKRIPCDKGRACSYRVRKQDEWEQGELLVGVCGRVCDRGEDCDDIDLTAADVKILELKVSLLGRDLAKALGCDPFESHFHPGTWQIAKVGDHSLPVMLTIQPDEGSFRAVVAELVAWLPQGFILLAPTKRFYKAAIRAMSAKINAGFFDLESHFTLTEDGKLEADNLGTELFARELAMSTARTPTPATLPPAFLIRQEATRQRAGKHDRTKVSTWLIRFDGPEVLMPTKVATEYLVYLIFRQGKVFDASETMAEVRKCGKSFAGESGADVNTILYGTETGVPDDTNQRGRVGELNERDVMWNESEIKDCIKRIFSLLDEKKTTKLSVISAAPIIWR